MPRCPNPRCQRDYTAGDMQCSNPFCQCLLPEAIVAGRYRIETLIGIGGMGAVYRASDTFEMKQVALKVLTFTNPNLDLETGVERFRREARYAHQLHHPNIVPVLNFGQDNKILYLAMPLVTGGTLKSLMHSGLPLPLQQIQRYLNELASAIDAIHQHPQQIIHRDIKPSNLLLHQDDGRLVVTDFGIARAIQQDKPLTQRGWQLGTEHYMAPEQRHGEAEPASDIYAMGVVAYQMLTGLLPFQAAIKSVNGELPTPSELNSTLPATIDAVILKAMEIDPRDRYHSARAFIAELNSAIDAEEHLWSAPTIAVPIDQTISPKTEANVIVRTVLPDNPCTQCGRENRLSSRFCRYCGNGLAKTSPMVEETCQIGYVSETGRHLHDNEDMMLVVQGLCITLTPPPHPFGLIAVADGLRGPQGRAVGGQEASHLAIETITDVLLPLLSPPPRTQLSHTPSLPAGSLSTLPIRKIPPDTIIEQWLRDAVRQANHVIYHCNADYETERASTLTVGLLYKRQIYLTSYGDSRAYRYNKHQGLQLLTQDTLTAQQQTGYLGQSYHIEIKSTCKQVDVDDLILLCTDGIWNALDDLSIQRLLEVGGDPQLLALKLVEAANRVAGNENISAIVVRVQ
ncbi:protein kinase domain-containing protein [Tengunoibacter tsumagoiensis]|uniref:non-specific serine/threonine protein kinase n=1 Tax=Tengunoibacter tsumagoiensis TaxID=2014871 RepID=A0A402A2F5_9CHLR|nr:protein kinase [Tengunoibacter tsumagoiensis]GCE13236.1 hypothetical protein KTT_30950 [Tengunoibacter tsumagoiensis]